MTRHNERLAQRAEQNTAELRAMEKGFKEDVRNAGASGRRKLAQDRLVHSLNRLDERDHRLRLLKQPTLQRALRTTTRRQSVKAAAK